MKNTCLSILALIFIAFPLDSTPAESAEINILFMGNSFTFRHDLPELVKQVFEEEQPGLTVNVEGIVYGGQDMFRHHDLYFSESIVRLNSITIPEIEKQIPRIKSFLEMDSPPKFYTAYWEKNRASTSIMGYYSTRNE